MNIITLNRVLLNNTPLNYRRKRILTEKDFYFKTIERTFTFSKSAGGKSIKDGRAYIKAIKGNSVVWNQHVPENYFSTGTKNGVTFTIEDAAVVLNGTAETDFEYQVPAAKKIGIINTHKYAVLGGEINKATYNIYDSELIGGAGRNNTIFAAIGTGLPTQRIYCYSGQTFTNYKIYPRLTDLTKMFQAGNEPTTIEEFYARVVTLGVDMNAYNEGEVIHCNTESIKSVGDNAWDEEWESGYYDVNNGQKMPAENLFRSVNHFRILPNNEYYLKGTGIRILYYDANMNYISYVIKSNGIVTSPPNACYASIFGENQYYSTDIMITLVHSGWKQDTDAGYQPYWQDTLPLPIIRKYFPDGMKSAGTAHDEIRYNSATNKWEKVVRTAAVDLGSLKWQYATATSIFYATGSFFFADQRLLCAKYTNIAGRNEDKNSYAVGGSVRILDSAYTDAGTFKASLQGEIMYYELAEPIVTELDAEDQNFRDYYNVADFGTEMSQSSVPSAALLADVGYYFKKSEVKELTLN